jgi:CHAT domain-containing protein/Tfp pilus assembly protein PilF
VRSAFTRREDGQRRVAHLACAALLLFSACREREWRHDGLRVAEVTPGGAAEKAGLAAGDLLLTWEGRPDASRRGRLRNAFDVAEVEAEEGPRGPLVIHGRRGAAPLSWTLPPGDWKLKPGVALPPAEADTRDDLLRRAAKADNAVVDEGLAFAETLRVAGRAADACWVLLQLGDARAALPAKDAAAIRFYDTARAIAREARSPLLETRAWEAEAWTAYKKNDYARADVAYREALRGRETLAKGDDTLALALARSRLASVAFYRGDLETPEGLWTRALATRERLAPDSLPTATCLNSLGALNSARGRLDVAEAFYRRALAIRERLVPDGLDVGQTLSNLGLVARRRGDFAAAEDFYARARAIFERVDPDGLDVANTLNLLAVLAQKRGDADAAEAYVRRALDIQQRNAPDSARVASCFNNLGEVYEERGRPDQAEVAYRRALAISEKVRPGSLAVAALLGNLGRLAAAAGHHARARDFIERALVICRRLAPQSVPTASVLTALGDVAFAERQLARATALHEEALAIRRRLAPSSASEAESHYALGRILRAQARPREALARWRQALDALESQRGRLAETEQGKTAFASRYRRVFTDTVELLVELRDPAAALHLLERSRARSFLAMLGDRDLVFATDDAPADLLKAQRRDDAAYDTAQARLAKLAPGKDDSEIDAQLAALQDLRQRRAATAAAIRRTSPRLASLQQPEPRDLDGIRAALDPGTLLLSYSAGETRTLLFALLVRDDGTAAPLEVAALPIGEAALRRRVEMFRGLIDRGRVTRAVEPALVAQSRRLFDDLLRPVHAKIGSARRLLILPDGPLHALPFAALMDPGPPARYLVEWRPLHIVASATVYAEIKKSPAAARAAGATPFVGFGDPVYAGAPATWATAQAARLAALPATRAEVDAISALYPGAVTYLGADATETRAKAVGRQPRLIHFACHGVLDPRFPLDSGLALTPPADRREGADNGLLQAWEIFERMHIDADLVALSACETGLGRDLGGEGLVGLVRAFQYAGARSVLASLWAVSDRSSADLMTGFYHALQSGLTRDEALQAAQVEALRRPATAHPFHWAAFQLSGVSS